MTQNGKPPILVVDDEPEILYSLRGLLRKDFSFHAAQSGYEAFRVLEQQTMHVVMADQRMPGMMGVDFLASLRARYPDIVRLIFTGYADLKAVIDAINRGHVFRYITKPWDPDDLQLVLRQACQHYQQAAQCQRLLNDLQGYVTALFGPGPENASGACQTGRPHGSRGSSPRPGRR